MLEWVQRHGLELMLLNFVYNSAVQAMPALDEHCSKLYQFSFRFAHSLAGNWKVVTK
jgi:hypothetical protein